MRVRIVAASLAQKKESTVARPCAGARGSKNSLSGRCGRQAGAESVTVNSKRPDVRTDRTGVTVS